MSVRHFKDLTVWQESKQLVVLTYKLTKEFPPDERFALVSQMKRASVSVSSNIAEGFGRKTHKDKEHFYVIAYGSLVELENQVLLAIELNFVNQETADIILNQISSVGQLINGLLRAHRRNN